MNLSFLCRWLNTLSSADEFHVDSSKTLRENLTEEFTGQGVDVETFGEIGIENVTCDFENETFDEFTMIIFNNRCGKTCVGKIGRTNIEKNRTA